MASSESRVHMAMFPSPGMGHLIPFVNLAKVLVERGHIWSATLILPSSAGASLESLPESIHIHHLPPMEPPNTDHHQSPESQIFSSIALSMDSARAALARLQASSTPVTALLVDPFGIDILHDPNPLNVPLYMYFGTAAINLLFTFHLSQFDTVLAANGLTDFEDSPQPFLLPGCPPLHGRDFGDPFKTRSTPIFERFLQIAEKSRSVDAILINTFTHLEPSAISAIKASSGSPPVFPIGPIVGPSSGPGTALEWLDGQPAGSVLYVSFGSGGALSYEQTTELALGLEESGERFLWVVRPPNDATSCPSYCGDIQAGSCSGFLPEGFEERTRGRGLVVGGWVPQVGVLAHGSTGGFLTHCGWNSALESLVHGVPMLAWPLYAEQRTNAVLLCEGLGVAIRPEVADRGLLARGEVAAAIRRIMLDGDVVRRRPSDLKKEADKALGHGGTSSLELIAFAKAFKPAACDHPVPS